LSRATDLVKSEVETLTLRKTVTSKSIFIQCPYHEDNTPSGGINVDETKTVPIGWFSCFGCNKSVPWNTLAKTLGLRQLKSRSQTSVEASDYIDPKRVRGELLGEDECTEEEEQKKIKQDLESLDFFDFPPEVPKWRGFDTSFLATLGVRYAYQDRSGEFLIWMPCNVNGVQVGYVKAFLEKVPGRISYINSPGKWSRQKGLLFFDQAIKMMKDQGHKTVVLTEGPRDALRCIRHGIPTMSILGTKSWSEDKRMCLENADVENLIFFMDGDKPDKHGVIAGKMATKMLIKSVKGYMGYSYVNMWKYGKGWDPGNCPKRFLDLVKNSLVKRKTS